MKRVLSVFGTRPESIKMAPVVLELKRRPQFEALVCVTAQHRQMLDQVLALFEIQPDVDLDLMQYDQTLESLTARAITGLGDVFEKLRPDVVLVQGDTTSAMAAGLAAFYKKIPVGHVEAGLRTDSRYRPFPEEMNRRLLGVLASYHFAPTARAANALRAEGVPESAVFVTGNPVVDALQWIEARGPDDAAAELLQRVAGSGERVVLVTLHRRESFGAELTGACEALLAIVRRNPDVRIVYPVHRNPNVAGPVTRLLGGEPHIFLVDPLPYPALVHVMKRAYLVLTDSGGIQEEAPVFGKPVLVLRGETERLEGVEAGVARIVGTRTQAIVDATQTLLDDEAAYRRMASAVSPYGDGHAAARIADILSA